MADSRIEVTCLNCTRPFRVPSSEKGRVVDCPHCFSFVDVPEHDEPLASAAIMENALPIELDDLTLRRVQSEDQSDLFAIYSNPDVCRYQLFKAWTAEEAEQFVFSQFEISAGDPGVPYVLVAEHRSDGKVVGDCQLTITSVPNRQGEIGFSLHPDYWGRGLATRMVNATLGFGFKHLELHRIAASVDVRNERSWRLMERVGMRREAHFVHTALIDGAWIDDYVYAMLDEAWHANNAT